MLNDISVNFLRIDESSHAEFSAPFFPGVIDIDADNLARANHSRALDDVETDAAEAEDHDVGSRRDFRGVDHRADGGGDAAADVTALVERRVVTDFGDGNFRKHRE